MVEISEYIKTTLRALEANRFEVEFVENRGEAVKIILDLIPRSGVVGIGDSATIRQLSILDELKKRGSKIINPFTEEFTINKPHLRGEVQIEALLSDVFLTSSNGVTIDGRIVNVDAVGNRVVGMIFGPKKVIIIVGKNKIVNNVDEALDRIRNVIAPYHAWKKRFKTPCATTRVCSDCDALDRICNVTTILNKRPRRIDATVVVINEDLGLGWDKTWPKERIDRIKTNYEEVTWVFKG